MNKKTKKTIFFSFLSLVSLTPLLLVYQQRIYKKQLSVNVSELDNVSQSVIDKKNNENIKLYKNAYTLLDEFRSQLNQTQNSFKGQKVRFKNSFKFDTDYNKNYFAENVDKTVNRYSDGFDKDKVIEFVSSKIISENNYESNIIFDPNNPSLNYEHSIPKISFTSPLSYVTVGVPGLIGNTYPTTNWEKRYVGWSFSTENSSFSQKIAPTKFNEFIWEFNQNPPENLNLILRRGSVPVPPDIFKLEFNSKLMDNKFFVSFKNKDVPFQKFFILTFQNIEKDNGQSYLGTNRPTIKLALNLPLFNGLNWLAQIPAKFNNLKKTFEEIHTKWKDTDQGKYRFLFNEIFGSKNNFFSFANNYLFNLANNYYDAFAYNGIKKLIDSLNNLEPEQHVRDTIRQLMNEQDTIYINKGVSYTIPKNLRNNSKTTNLSGSNYFIQVLLNELNFNTVVFDDNITLPNSNFWNVSEFAGINENNTANTINFWTAWNNVLLPIILNQNIYADIKNEAGNQSTNNKRVLLYNSNSLTFPNIPIAGVDPDFDSPYSKVTINNINFGEGELKPFLGNKTTLNKNDLLQIIEQTKKYSTVKNIVDNNDYINKNKYIEMNDEGIELQFNFLQNPKQLEDSAWSKIKNDKDINKFMLIPDAAWGVGEQFDTTPDSTLKELLQDGMKSIILFERTMGRPFINKVQVTTDDLKKAREKFVNYNTATLIFNKDNIANVFITKQFKNKYNETSTKPWWTWTFTELVLEEKKFSIDKDPQATEVVKKDYYQEEWFKNFVANKQLKTKTLADFFPKENEGRVFVVGSYKPAITSADVILKSTTGFWFAGEQRDDFNRIKNYNYVIELEVKNKIYNSRLSELDLNSQHSSTISFTQFIDAMNTLTENWKQYFKIDSDRFVKDQIQEPKLSYIPNISSNPFEANGYGFVTVNYQNSLPLINQIGNEEIIERLPFNMNNLIGINDFRNKYNNYIIEDPVAYKKLSTEAKEQKILIDNNTNKFVFGGKALAEMQKITVNGLSTRGPVVITNQYIDPSVTIFGFDQKTKNRETFADFQKRWSNYSQQELFNLLFSKVNTAENLAFLKDTIQRRKVIFKVVINPDDFKVIYSYQDSIDPNKIWTDDYMNPMPLNEIRAIRLDLMNPRSFIYGYNREKDYDLPFEVMASGLKNVNELINHFNFNDDFERESFLKGLKVTKINTDITAAKITITVNLDKNFITYNANDPLTFSVSAKQMKKVELGNLDLKNIDRKIKEDIVNKQSEDMLVHLNSLDLNTKKTFFDVENKKIKLFLQKNNDQINNTNYQINAIIFRMDGNNLIADVEFTDDSLILAKSSKNSIDNFVYNLKVDLGIINPFRDKMIPALIGSIVALMVAISAFIGFLFYRRKKQRKAFSAIDNSKYHVDLSGLDDKNDE